MKKLLITGWIPEDCVAPYRDSLEIVMPDSEKKYFTADEVAALIVDCDALFTVASFPCRRELIDLGPKLKAIANHGVGYDNIDHRYATQKGIFIVNTPNGVLEVTSEFAIALIMTAARGILQYDKSLRQTGYCQPSTFFDRDMLLLGKTLGILGFGRIGRSVAKKAQGIGMQIIYYDPIRQTPEKERELSVEYASFDELIARADVVTCHMLYTPENHHVINMDVFRRMKKNAYFVNVARGPIMCESDLVQALKTGEIRGAATDVYEFEPKVTKELLELDNVVVTPHAASNVLEARKNMVIEVLSGIDSLFKGKRPPNIANPQLF